MSKLGKAVCNATFRDLVGEILLCHSQRFVGVAVRYLVVQRFIRNLTVSKFKSALVILDIFYFSGKAVVKLQI